MPVWALVGSYVQMCKMRIKLIVFDTSIKSSGCSIRRFLWCISVEDLGITKLVGVVVVEIVVVDVEVVNTEDDVVVNVPDCVSDSVVNVDDVMVGVVDIVGMVDIICLVSDVDVVIS